MICFPHFIYIVNIICYILVIYKRIEGYYNSDKRLFFSVIVHSILFTSWWDKLGFFFSPRGKEIRSTFVNELIGRIYIQLKNAKLPIKWEYNIHIYKNASSPINMGSGGCLQLSISTDPGPKWRNWVPKKEILGARSVLYWIFKFWIFGFGRCIDRIARF